MHGLSHLLGKQRFSIFQEVKSHALACLPEFSGERLELLEEVAVNDQLTRYTIRGSDYGETIRPGESVTIGFNASQGTELGTSGTPTLNDLFQADAMSDLIPGLTTSDSFV